MTTTTSFLSKRKRRENPHSEMDNESLTHLSSPYGPIVTPLASSVTKEIVLERLVKELVTPFRLALSVPRRRKQQYRSSSGSGDSSTGIEQDKGGPSKGRTSSQTRRKRRRLVDEEPPRRSTGDDNDNNEDHASHPSILCSRLVMGTNQCTRVLEGARTGTHGASAASSIPSLILLARDVYPPTMLAHVPYLASRHVLNCPLLLLPGRASHELGRALGVKKTAIVVFLSRRNDDECKSHDDDTWHARIDSFVSFVVSKMDSKDDLASTFPCSANT